MIRINLLPHREVKRAARQRQFTLLMGSVAALGIGIVVLGYLTLESRQHTQTARNQYLQDQIASLDRDIASIKKLKEQTQSLLARKQAVETLQTNRSGEVHLFDQLVRQLPEGIYLSAIKQTGTTINLQGYAQSSARVSTLIRNLEASPWLESPVLIEIKAATVQKLRANEFNLNVKQTQPQNTDDSTGKGGKA